MRCKVCIFPLPLSLLKRRKGGGGAWLKDKGRTAAEGQLSSLLDRWIDGWKKEILMALASPPTRRLDCMSLAAQAALALARSGKKGKGRAGVGAWSWLAQRASAVVGRKKEKEKKALEAQREERESSNSQ